MLLVAIFTPTASIINRNSIPTNVCGVVVVVIDMMLFRRGFNKAGMFLHRASKMDPIDNKE